MSDLQKYRISAAHKRGVRASGFDARDPDQRHPVMNPILDRVALARSSAKQQDPRANALIRAKDKILGRTRDHALIFAFALSSYPGITANRAFAADTFSNPDTAHTHPEWPLLEIIAAVWESIPDLRDPVWVPMLLSAILAALIATALTQSYIGVRPMPRQPHCAPSKPTPASVPVSSKPCVIKRPSWRTDASSRRGKVRQENQDAFRVVDLPGNRTALVVCDGAGGVEGGKLAAETVADGLESGLTTAFKNELNLSWKDVVESIFARARDAVQAQKEAGITTAIVALLDGRSLHFATLGDGALTLIWPDGMIQNLLAPHHRRDQPSNVIAGYIGHDCSVPPRIGTLRIEPGSLLLAMSDGVSDLLPFDGIAGDREAIIQMFDVPGTELADHFLAQIEAARDPDTGAYLHHDNMTLAIGVFPNAQRGPHNG